MTATITGLFHVAIKTADLEATRRFYVEVLGLAEVARPDFGYPGAWIGVPLPGGQAIIHIYAGGPALGPSGIVENGTAAIDFSTIGDDFSLMTYVFRGCIYGGSFSDNLP